MGNNTDGAILSGQPQGVRPGGAGITIAADGIISVDSQSIVGVMKLGQTAGSAAAAYNGYTWPGSPGSAGQQLETNGAGILSWADADGIDWTQKGQLIVGTGAGTDTLLNVGGNTSFLISDSSTASGLIYSGSSTSAAQMPAGDGTQRPSPAAAGQFRFNTGSLAMEFWDGAAWSSVASSSLLGLGLTTNNIYTVTKVTEAAVPPTPGTGQTQAILGSTYYDDNLGQLFLYYSNGGSPVWAAV
jgi:hypothetical protein